MLTTRIDVSRCRAPAARQPSRDFVNSRQIGPWQLVSLLGGGAWTRVYRARPADTSDEHPADYAVKVACGRGVDGNISRVLLRREAQVGKLVSHPHLAPILSSQLDAMPHFVVMPRLAGVSLAATLSAHSRLAAPHALWIARQTAEALGALHSRGWRHADVKPANIIVSPQGHATLLDLGFARSLDESTVGKEAGSLTASFAYCAPELFTSTVCPSAASDLYSLGVMLYEMLTGRLPFLETDPTDLAVAHLQQIAPEPRSLAPQLHPRVEWLLKRLLAKEPLRRPETSELVALLVELEVETFEERAA